MTMPPGYDQWKTHDPAYDGQVECWKCGRWLSRPGRIESDDDLLCHECWEREHELELEIERDEIEREIGGDE